MIKTLLRALRYITPYWMLQVAALVCALVGTASNFVMPWANMQLIDKVFLAQDDGRRAALFFIMFASAGGMIVGMVANLGKSYLFARVGENAAADLRRDLFRHLHALPMSYFDIRKTGGVMSVVQNDVEAMQGLYSSTLVEATSNILMAVVAIFILFSQQSVLTFIGLPVPILFGVAVALFGKPLQRSGLRVREETGHVQEVLQETISGVREVKAFGRMENELQRYMTKVRSLIKARVGFAVLGATNGLVASIIGFGGIMAVFLIGGLMTIEHPKQFSPGSLIMFVNVLGMLFGPVSALVGIYSMTAGALGAAQRIFEFRDSQVEEEQPDAKDLVVLRGEVSFQHVNFRYSDEGLDVLHDICLDVKPGEAVALVGPSGSGKTTLVSILPRLYDPQQGHVFIDGVDTRTISLVSLRDQIAVVPQEPFLFGTTVKENIAFGCTGATEDQVIAAAQAANAHEFICALPEGYETDIGERGTRLSVGQKQRIAIARAILRNPRILILDEATSAQDAESERQVQEAMRRLMENRTSFVIAHRLATVLRADRIVVLESGRIAEIGTHAELIANGNLYARLHALQFSDGEVSSA